MGSTLERRYASLSELGDPLERLNNTVDWEIFRPDLERIDQKVRKSAAGCKPTCRVLMFKLLILQRLYGLSPVLCRCRCSVTRGRRMR